MSEVLGWIFAGAWYATYLRIYGIVAFSHILFEYFFAILYARKMRVALAKSEAEEAADPSKVPNEPIAALIPAFQEGSESLRLCLDGVLHQIYNGPLLAVVVDDGSYLQDIKRYEQLVANPPEVTLEWWQWAALRIFPFLGRYRLFQPPVTRYQARLDELRAKRHEILALCQSYEDAYPKRFKFIASPQNQGKRRAHKTGHDWVRRNFDAWIRLHYSTWLQGWLEEQGARLRVIFPWGYLTVDSDTILDPFATTCMVRALDRENAGAATGYVDILNANQNWLTRLVDQRYWSAFFVERAAQSWFGSMLCCSGPLSLYRGSILDDETLGLMDLYVTQTFLGVLCTFGDDRRMTYLIMRAGFKTIFVPEAHCLTYAPTTLGEYKRQQTRWNMSFYRELILSLREVYAWNLYTTYEMLMQLVLPFALFGGVVITAWLVVFEGRYEMALLYVATVVGIGLVRSVYGVAARRVEVQDNRAGGSATRVPVQQGKILNTAAAHPGTSAHVVSGNVKTRPDWAYLTFALYGFLYLWLLYVRGKALIKLFAQRDTTWQTRAVS